MRTENTEMPMANGALSTTFALKVEILTKMAKHATSNTAQRRLSARNASRLRKGNGAQATTTATLTTT